MSFEFQQRYNQPEHVPNEAAFPAEHHDQQSGGHESTRQDAAASAMGHVAIGRPLGGILGKFKKLLGGEPKDVSADVTKPDGSRFIIRSAGTIISGDGANTTITRSYGPGGKRGKSRITVESTTDPVDVRSDKPSDVTALGDVTVNGRLSEAPDADYGNSPIPPEQPQNPEEK
jgi:hypothetical protein